MYPEISFKPAQSVHIQGFDLSAFGQYEDHQETLDKHKKKVHKSRDGGLNNLKWKSEKLLNEDPHTQPTSSMSLNKTSSDSYFKSITFEFENHLFNETRISRKITCQVCDKLIIGVKKRICCKKCNLLMHSDCFKNFDGTQCPK